MIRSLRSLMGSACPTTRPPAQPLASGAPDEEGRHHAVRVRVRWLAAAVFTVWALIDSQSRPEAAWRQIGQSKQVWLVVLIVGLLFCLVGLVADIVYLASVRPKLEAASPTDAGL